MSLKLYNISDEYINYLRKFDKKVFSNKEDDRKHSRKYLGIILIIDEFNYFVPLSSPKDTDYIIEDGTKIIRKNTIPIIRIISEDSNGNEELKGTLKFSNMIPVPDFALIDYDVYSETDEDYKILVTKEIAFISANKKTIINNAKVIYNQKTKNYKNIKYLENTVNFKLLEQKCKEYKTIQEVIIDGEEQHAPSKEE